METPRRRTLWLFALPPHRPIPLLLALSPFPGRHRVRVGPEPLAGGLGGLLDLRELALLSYWTYRQASPLATNSRFMCTPPTWTFATTRP